MFLAASGFLLSSGSTLLVMNISKGLLAVAGCFFDSSTDAENLITDYFTAGFSTSFALGFFSSFALGLSSSFTLGCLAIVLALGLMDLELSDSDDDSSEEDSSSLLLSDEDEDGGDILIILFFGFYSIFATGLTSFLVGFFSSSLDSLEESSEEEIAFDFSLLLSRLPPHLVIRLLLLGDLVGDWNTFFGPFLTSSLSLALMSRFLCDF